MQSPRFVLCLVLISLTTIIYAQTHPMPDKSVTLSDAQRSFDSLKTLAGTWKGSVTTTPLQADIDAQPMWVSMRVTSRGHALVHEMKEPGTPDEPTKKDDPVTMIYLDGERLLLTHYCDAGNRPRMLARQSPDGKKVEFDFAELSGGNEYGHMHHVVFTIIDNNHHIEDWTYMGPGDQPLHAVFDLKRVTEQASLK